MSLRSGVSYWRTLGLKAVDTLPLADDAFCEVVVLGSGVTGALVAHQLVKQGVDAILLDRSGLGAGSTAASTGLLQHEIDTPLVELIKKVGRSHAVHAYARGLTAIDQIEQLTEELGDDCGFSRRETTYFASRPWHYFRLKREYECRREHGFDLEFLTRKTLKKHTSIRAAAAIRARGDAQIDPYRFTQCLLRRASTLGLRIYAHTEATDVHESSWGVKVQTPTGAVSARRIVFATGYDSYRYLQEDPGTLHSTYAVASEPISEFVGWPDGSLIWETSRPYFYARQTEDQRAIIGGGDTMFSSDHQRDNLVERKATRLRKRFRTLFPDIVFEPACSWAGTFGESKDGLAYIGQPANRPHTYFAIGYGGNGITFSMIAAKLITDLYFGRPNDDAAVFRFGR